MTLHQVKAEVTATMDNEWAGRFRDAPPSIDMHVSSSRSGYAETPHGQRRYRIVTLASDRDYLSGSFPMSTSVAPLDSSLLYHPLLRPPASAPSPMPIKEASRDIVLSSGWMRAATAENLTEPDFDHEVEVAGDPDFGEVVDLIIDASPFVDSDQGAENQVIRRALLQFKPAGFSYDTAREWLGAVGADLSFIGADRTRNLQHQERIVVAREQRLSASASEDWLRRAAKILEDLESLPESWAGPEGVRPSHAVLRDVERVVNYLPSKTETPEVEVDHTTGFVTLTWWSPSAEASFSLVFVDGGRVVGVTSRVSGEVLPPWKYDVRDERKIVSSIEQSPLAMSLLNGA